MSAQDYYDKNTILHGGEGAVSPVLETGKLPARPSEVDLALIWLKMNCPGGSLLDIGCAQLNVLRAASRMFDRCVGIDISRFENWDRHPSIETVVHNLDSGNLPFEDGTFDAVAMLMVLEHVFDPFHSVREIRRVIKQDGCAVIAVPNIASIKHRFGLLFGRLPITSTRFSFNEDAWDGYHIHNFTQRSLEWLLKREGLRPVQWRAQGRLQFLKRQSPSVFGHDLIAFCRPTEPGRDLSAEF